MSPKYDAWSILIQSCSNWRHFSMRIPMDSPWRHIPTAGPWGDRDWKKPSVEPPKNLWCTWPGALGPWGPGTGLPKVCLKTLGSRSRLLSFEMRNETKGIQRLLNEIVEFVYVCFQAISRWPSNDFRWLTGVLYCSSSPAMENFEVPDVESSQVPPCTNPITSVVCHQMLGTCCMTVPVRNRPVRRFKP